GEPIDHADRIGEVAASRGREHVAGESLLAAVAHLPAHQQVLLHRQDHLQDGPAQERHLPPARSVLALSSRRHVHLKIAKTPAEIRGFPPCSLFRVVNSIQVFTKEDGMKVIRLLPVGLLVTGALSMGAGCNEDGSSAAGTESALTLPKLS